MVTTEQATAVLGATGGAGQCLIPLLASYPCFRLHAVGASARSAGKKYGEVVKWKQNVSTSKELGDLIVKECKAEEFQVYDLMLNFFLTDII